MDLIVYVYDVLPWAEDTADRNFLNVNMFTEN